MAKKILRKIKSKTGKFAVFDIETYKWVNPYAVGFYDGEDYFEFLGKDCIRDFLNHVLTKKYRGMTIYAHNGGRFDFNFLMEILKDNEYKVDMIFQGARCLLLKVYLNIYTNEKGKITHSNVLKFADSVSLLRFKLDDLTKNFDVEHKKLNFMDKKSDERDYEYLYRLFKENDKRFHDYLKNDVYGLHEVLLKFNELIQQNNGKLGLTIASTSLNTFKKGYLSREIKMTDRETNDEMKKAYFGGRTEIFRMFLPEKKYRCYDVNSLYPYVMFNHRFPVGKPKNIKNPKVKDIKENMGITKCKVTAPDDLYLPVLPYKLDLGSHHKLVFPLGRFSGYWDNAQLTKALELGYRIEPEKMMVFTNDFLFKDYVHNFYELKKASKSGTPSYILAKLMLNSLYGKFAQNQDSEMMIKVKNPKDLDEYEVTDVVDADRGMFKVKTESQGNFFIPQISIHVTALAQLRLYKFMEELINKGKWIAYCDTDSLFTDGFLKTSDKLGDMKKEYTFRKGYFLLPKTYCIIKQDGTEKVKAKGFKPNFQKQLHESDFKKAIFNHDLSGFKVETEKVRFNTMKTSFVRHKRFVSTNIQRKSVKAKYDKRIILSDYDTKPIKINKPEYK